MQKEVFGNVNTQMAYQNFINRLYTIDNEYTIQVIIGIDKLLNSSEIDASDFSEKIAMAEQSKKFRFIIVDNPKRLKNHEYENWYKNYLSGENGIWIGNGIDNQFLININSNRRELVNDCGRDFGYLVEEGNAKFIKLIGMKEKGD